MKCLVVLMIETEQPEALSARKLVVETAKHNVLTAYDAQSGLDARLLRALREAGAARPSGRSRRGAKSCVLRLRVAAHRGVRRRRLPDGVRGRLDPAFVVIRDRHDARCGVDGCGRLDRDRDRRARGVDVARTPTSRARTSRDRLAHRVHRYVAGVRGFPAA